ncbi:MAG: RNA polymerase sigma factor [Thermoanaerobaculaceae bacterium]
MQRVARDDEQALAELVAALGPSLLGFVQRALGSRGHEAEDVAQEAFIRLWRARHRWRPAATVQTYLFTIAARLCLNRQRGWRRRPATPLISDENAIALEPRDQSPDPERLAASAELGRSLREEMFALAPNQRLALLLKLVEGLRYDEIAAALDCSASAVESLLSRGRARLRQRLARFWTEGNPGGRG